MPGDTALAYNAQHELLIETRGKGGFMVVAPSHGTVHPTGKPYVMVQGGPATIATVTAAELETLHDLAVLVRLLATSRR